MPEPKAEVASPPQTAKLKAKTARNPFETKTMAANIISFLSPQRQAVAVLVNRTVRPLASDLNFVQQQLGLDDNNEPHRKIIAAMSLGYSEPLVVFKAVFLILYEIQLLSKNPKMKTSTAPVMSHANQSIPQLFLAFHAGKLQEALVSVCKKKNNKHLAELAYRIPYLRAQLPDIEKRQTVATEVWSRSFVSQIGHGLKALVAGLFVSLFIFQPCLRAFLGFGFCWLQPRDAYQFYCERYHFRVLAVFAVLLGPALFVIENVFIQIQYAYFLGLKSLFTDEAFIALYAPSLKPSVMDIAGSVPLAERILPNGQEVALVGPETKKTSAADDPNTNESEETLATTTLIPKAKTDTSLAGTSPATMFAAEKGDDAKRDGEIKTTEPTAPNFFTPRPERMN